MKDLAEDLYDGQVLQKLFGKKRVGYSRGCLYPQMEESLTFSENALFSIHRGSPEMGVWGV